MNFVENSLKIKKNKEKRNVFTRSSDSRHGIVVGDQLNFSAQTTYRDYGYREKSCHKQYTRRRE